MRTLQELLVLRHLFLILTGVDHLELTQIGFFKFVTLLGYLVQTGLLLLLGKLDFLTSEHAFLHDLLVLSDPTILPLGAQVEQVDCIGDQERLDALVQARFCFETGRLIYLDQPGLAVFIDEDVEAQYLEAELVFVVLGLAPTMR